MQVKRKLLAANHWASLRAHLFDTGRAPVHVVEANNRRKSKVEEGRDG